MANVTTWEEAHALFDATNGQFVTKMESKATESMILCKEEEAKEKKEWEQQKEGARKWRH